MYQNKPQKMGSGSTTRYITFESTIGTNATIMNLGNQLYTDEEIQNYMQRYNYMKIANIKVKITPTSTTGKIYILGQWNSKDETVTVNDLINNDSTKIIATHAIRFQTRTWLPPNMNVTKVDKTTAQEYISTINLANYNRTDDYYYSKGTTPATYSILYPFTLAMKATASIEVTVIVKVVFRGEKYTPTLNALMTIHKEDKELQEKVKKLIEKEAIKKEFVKNEIKEEEKKEEEEQEEEIKEDEENDNMNGKKDAINDIINKIKNL
jgi:hypothetical protein